MCEEKAIGKERYGDLKDKKRKLVHFLGPAGGKNAVPGIRRGTALLIFCLFLLLSFNSSFEPFADVVRTSAGDEYGDGSTTKAMIDDAFWAETSVEKLFTYSRYKEETPIWSNRDDTIRISMARNEYESFQMAFRPMNAFQETVTLNQLEMKRDGGERYVLGTGNISLYDVEYAGSAYPDPLVPYPSDGAGENDSMTGEPEWLSWDLELLSGVTKALWVTIRMPSRMPAGIYEANVTFTQAGGETVRSLEVKVWGFTLPDRPSLDSWFECSTGSYPAYYPFDYGESEHAEFMKNVYEKFKEHRISPGKLSTAEPWFGDFDVDANGTVSVNFTRSDPLMEYYLDELNLSLFEFPLTAYSPVRWDTGAYDFSSPPYEPTAAYKDVIGQYIKLVADHYREKGWLNRSVVYYSDEPYAFTISASSPHKHPPYSLQRDMNQLIKANAPDLRHLITKAVEPALYGSGDIWDSPHSYYHLNDASQRQAQGEDVWWYNVGGGIEEKGMGLRALYWDSFDKRVDGVEHWGVNYWDYHTLNDDPWVGSTVNGDGYLFYPGPEKDIYDDVVISIRLELVREGLEDYEYLVKYASKFGRSGAEAVASSVIPASNFAKDPHDISDGTLYGVREYLAKAITATGDGLSLWRHGLNGTRSGPGPWDDFGVRDDYGSEGIVDMENLTKTWSGDGGVVLKRRHEATLLSGCDAKGGWTLKDQGNMNSSIDVENSPEKHLEGVAALNFSFWRNDANVTRRLARVQTNSVDFSNLSRYDLLEFDCMPAGMSLNNFYIELGFDTVSWYTKFGRFSRTGTLPGRWHHVILDISDFEREQLRYIQLFAANTDMEIPFRRYSLLVDNITVRSAKRVSEGDITFEAVDLGPVPTGKWYVEVLGDHSPGVGGVNVSVRSSEDGTDWDDWHALSGDNGSLFRHASDYLPARYVQLMVTLRGGGEDDTVSPRVSEVRIWHAPVVYTDISISGDTLDIVPKNLSGGEAFHLEAEIINPGTHTVENAYVRIIAEEKKGKGTPTVLWEKPIRLPPGTSELVTENMSLTAGEFYLKMTVELPPDTVDPYSDNNTFTSSLRVNAWPVPEIEGPDRAEIHKPVTFDGTGSYDPDGTTVVLSWNMGDGTSLTGPMVEHAYTDPGGYTVDLTVTDDDGVSVTMHHSIELIPTVPMVEIAYTPEEGNVTTEYILYVEVFDPMDMITDYTWELSTGQNRKGSQIAWTFSDDGWHNISLSVDYIYQGKTKELLTWKHIFVNNLPPRVRVSVSGDGHDAKPGDSVTFSAEDSYDMDDDKDSLTYRWRFGDGATAEGAIVRHAYQSTGVYEVNLTVTDEDGESNWTVFEILVHTELPVPLVDMPEKIFVNETVLFDASTSHDPDGEIVEYEWILTGPGINGSIKYSGKGFNYVFADPGNYTLVLKVTDDTGDSARANWSVVVEERGREEVSAEAEGMWSYVWIVIVVVLLISIAFFFYRKKEDRPPEEEPEREVDPEEEREKREREYSELYEKEEAPSIDWSDTEEE